MCVHQIYLDILLTLQVLSNMCLRVLKCCFLLISIINGSKYIIETEGKIWDSDYIIASRYDALGESRDLKVETEIARIEATNSSGDYSLSQQEGEGDSPSFEAKGERFLVWVSLVFMFTEYCFQVKRKSLKISSFSLLQFVNKY